MSKVKTVWFLPRTRDNPPAGAMVLGNIITTPHSPEERVNQTPPPPVSEDDLRKFEEKEWSWTKEFKRSESGGIFASFLEWLGLGGSIEGSSDSFNKEIYDAAVLKTEYFIPSKSYLEAIMQEEAVADAVKTPKFKKQVFVITGLKTAYGATKAIEAMEKNEFHAQFGVNLAPLGGPVDFGPKGSLSREENETGNPGRRNFVFGFQLREIKYNKEVITVPYNQGTLYEGDRIEERPLQPEPKIEVLGLEEKELTAAAFGMSSVEIPGDTEDEVIEYIYPEE